MSITPVFTLVNSAGVSQALADSWQALASYAFQQWSAVLAGDATLNVRLEIVTSTSSGRAQGGPVSVTGIAGPNAWPQYEGTPAYELRHGTNSNGTAADILIQVQASYLQNELFLDPTPATAGDIPTNKTDGLSVLLHEIGHAFAFTGYYVESTNTFSYDAHSPYDDRLDVRSGGVFFDGPNVRAVYGDAVPLTHNNFAHYGNTNAPPGSGDPLTGLMNGVVFYRGTRYGIGDLDKAFFADVGLGTDRNDIFDQSWLDVVRGGGGNDTYIGVAQSAIVELAGGGSDTAQSAATVTALAANVERLILTGTAAINGTGNALANQVNGNTANNLLSGLDGNDTLAGAAGADTLNGGTGADRLTGGTQRDKLIPGNDSDPDVLVFNTLNDSTGVTRDVISGLDLNGEDRIDLPGTVSGIAAAITIGTLSTASFNADLAAAITAAALPAGRALLFDPSAGDLNQTGMVYLVVDANGIAGYQANQDWVFQLENHTGTLNPADFM